MQRRDFLKTVAAGALGLSALPTANAKTPKKAAAPNIMVVMVDDMGFSDLGCYGGEIDTPNIDSLADNGLRFTQFRNCARCCPTRAALLTGQYPHEVGLTVNGRTLASSGVTIPEMLKPAGYNTAMVGKWHLSHTPTLGDRHQKWLDHHIQHEPFAPIDSYPVNRGFDKFYGVIWGVIDYFDPFSLVEGVKPVKQVPQDYYFTDAITDKAVDYIKGYADKDEPFFMYYAHCAPHWPLHAKKKDIEKYRGTYDDGWEKLRKDRYQRQLELGLFDEKKAPLPDLQDGGRKWDELPEDEKAYQRRKMEVHAAMIDCIDQNMGRVIEILKQTGQYENTLILFLSDNGASPESYPTPGYDRTAYTRDGRKVLYNRAAPVEKLGSETSYCGIGQAWANAANTPFKYWKKESYEGGCNTPLIVHWPAGLKTTPGSITHQSGHVMDIAATCLELSGASYPQKYKGHTINPIHGESLKPIIEGKVRQGHDTIFFEHEFGRAVIFDGWKLVDFSGPREQWELYHLEQDLTETRNVAAQYPDKFNELEAKWTEWAKDLGLKQRYNNHNVPF
ncbi:Arylsulfatase [Anaerohalosphaera lusitana]|uniref:Arylsulfatase n=1 Tax=Anaerohalosphaera lusitana TaxID=1936003 RepID=A0A1U9NMI4_9BACT|nr:arylsulfatase [Anaerohalosphaera lusitana]AQT69119.1 Arylsulfatase [Anaerohalosphaera lusitana]